MTNNISDLPVVQILENLRNLDKTFANVLLINHFKGYHYQLLTDFMQEKLNEEQVISKWNKITFSGDLLKDIKISSLDVINRLKLVTIILNKLDIDTKDVELMFDKEISPQTLLYSLAFLIKDLVNKDSLRIHSKDVHSEIINLLAKKEEIISSPFIEVSDSVMEKVVAITPPLEMEEEKIINVPSYDSFADDIEEEDNDFLEDINEEDEIDSIDSVDF
jgi:hypothetical protein